MKIVVLGAGAVGGYFGGRLAEADFPVTFLVRENRFNQLKQSGLVVHSVKGDFSIKPSLATKPEEIESPDLVIIGLKNYHLAGAMETLKHLVNKGAKILPLLNGVQHLDLLTQELGEEAVLGGSCYIESTLNAKGEVVHTSPMQDIVFGSLTGKIDEGFLDQIEAMMLKAGITVKKSDTILTEMWNKYIFLATLSGITASIRQPIGVALKDSVTYSFLKELVTEICEVAKSRKVHFSTHLIDQFLERLKGLNPAMTSSMHRDLEKGQPMELESLHGALIKMAEEGNLQTPCLRSIYALLHPYKDGQPCF